MHKEKQIKEKPEKKKNKRCNSELNLNHLKLMSTKFSKKKLDNLFKQNIDNTCFNTLQIKTMKKNSPLNLSQNIKFLEKYRTVDLSSDKTKYNTDRDMPSKTPSHLKLNLKMNTNLNYSIRNKEMKKLFL